MKRAALILALVWGSALAQAELALTWQEDYLQVDYGAGQAVCVWLVGGGLPDARVSAGCLPSGQLRLPYTGVDRAYTPLGRGAIELRGVNGLVASRALTPPSRAVLPVVVAPAEGERFTVILPLVAVSVQQ